MYQFPPQGDYPPAFGPPMPFGPQGDFMFCPGDMPMPWPCDSMDGGCPYSPEPEVYRKKSLCGPATEEEKMMHMRTRSFRQGGNGTEPPSKGGLSRSGSVFGVGSRGGSLTRMASSRDMVVDAFYSEREERDMLKEFYGEMADRNEQFEYRGAKAIGSRRNVDGKDVALPRAKAKKGTTGYGGVTSHREAVMMAGGKWGNLELYGQKAPPPPMPELEPPMMPMMPPMVMANPQEPVRVMSQIEGKPSYPRNTMAHEKKKPSKDSHKEKRSSSTKGKATANTLPSKGTSGKRTTSTTPPPLHSESSLSRNGSFAEMRRSSSANLIQAPDAKSTTANPTREQPQNELSAPRDMNTKGAGARGGAGGNVAGPPSAMHGNGAGARGGAGGNVAGPPSAMHGNGAGARGGAGGNVAGPPSAMHGNGAGARGGAGGNVAGPPSGMGGNAGGESYMRRNGSMSGADGSMYGGMRGGQGMGSMYEMGGPMGGSMYRKGGSTSGPTGSMYGGMSGGQRMGSMYGMGGPMGGSMYRKGGSMSGPTGGPMGSMYGMGGPMGGPMGSMYGMGGPMGGPMGSMYGMGGPMGSMYGMGGPMGSMYGMGGPMGSMYGMGGLMGSMYGMGGPMGSMYGMGGPMGGSTYRMGGSMRGPMGSMYGSQRGMGSMYGVGSMYGSGVGISLLSIGGLWAPPDHFQLKKKKDADIPRTASSNGLNAAPKMVSEKNESRNVVKEEAKGETKKADGDALKPKQLETKPEPQAGAVKETKPSPTASPLDLNDNVHVLVVVSDNADSSVVEKEAGKKVSVKDTKGSTVVYEADEVLRASKATVEKSVLLNALQRQVEASHHCAVILANGKQQQSANLSVAKSLLKSVVAALNADGKKGTKAEVHMTAAAMPTVDSVKDLFAASKKEAKPLELGSNPIFGTCIMGLEDKPVKSEGDAEKLLEEALKASSDANDTVFVHLLVKQIKKPSSTTTDVCLSAMQFVFVKERGDYLAALYDKDEQIVPVSLFKDAVGGNSCTLVVVAIAGKDAAGETKILDAAEKLRKVKNAPPRSGHLNRFVEFTKEQEKKCSAAVESSKDSTEKTRNERDLRKLRTLLADTKELVDKPEGTKPKVYPSSQTAHESTTGGEKSNAESAKRQKDHPSPQGGSKSATEKEKPNDAKAPATEAPAAVKMKALGSGDSAGNGAEPWQISSRVAVCFGAAPRSNTIELSVKGETKKYDVDEHIQYIEGRAVDSKVAKRMQSILENGHNTALLGAELVPGLAVEKQITWNLVQSIIEGVLKGTKKGVTNEFTAYMCVVKGRRVVSDLFGHAEAKPLVVASSPLYGVVVHEATPKVLMSVAEVRPAFSSALVKAASLVKDDEYIVCTAVLKQILDGDVKVASLFATSALDMRPYVGVMEKSPHYKRELFGHAFIGSCSSVVLVSYATLDEKSMDALNAQRKIVLTNSKSRGGSVKMFVKTVEEAIASAKEKIEKAPTPEDKMHSLASMKQLQERVADAKKLLEKPKVTQPRAYVPPQRESSAIDSTVRVVAVITEKRGGGGSCSVRGNDDGDGFLVKASGGETKFPVDEVVQRPNSAAGIRSTTVDTMVGHFVSGYNVALLTVDDDGVSTGADILMRSAQTLFLKLEEGGEIFFMLSALKADGSATKDLLSGGADYEAISYASSPLFGPCIADARMEQAKTAADLLGKLKTGVSTCEADKAVLTSLILHKARKADGDVVISSFLTVLAGTNVKLYSKALEMRPKERGLFQCALGGSCITVFSLGLTASTAAAETAMEFGGLAKSVHGTSNLNVRDGGLRRFVSFSSKALAQMQMRLKSASGSEKERLVTSNANMDLVHRDAEEMLCDPKGRLPKIYKQTS